MNRREVYQSLIMSGDITPNAVRRIENSDDDLTERVTVACSFCGMHVSVPFHCGAVLPSNDGPFVYAWVPTLQGGSHDCQDRRAWTSRRYAPGAPGSLAKADRG